jgi:hypothetical protein
MVSINQELARQITELAETALEGLEHVQRQNMEGKFEQTMPLFTDVIEAFTEIEKILALNGLLDNPEDALASSTQSLKDGFDLGDYSFLVFLATILVCDLLPLTSGRFSVK